MQAHFSVFSSSGEDTSFLQTGIHASPTHRSWALVTEQSTYALGVTDEGYVLNLYWGPRLSRIEDLPVPHLPPERASQGPALTIASEEYPGFGGLRYAELAAVAVFADATRDLDLRYAGAEIGERDGLPTLSLSLQDALYPLRVILHYQVDRENDLIVRSARFVNAANDSVLLLRAFSAVWHLPRQFAGRHLHTLAGEWAGETRLQSRALVAGTALIESRHGITGAAAYPWFAVTSDAVEQAGDVYFGTLAWSGSWSIRTHTTITDATAIAGGINDHDFAWHISPQESFDTPPFVAGFATDGFNGMRRRLHRYTRTTVLPQTQAKQPRPVLYNSWEATFFDVTEEGQSALAERAARLGTELFVVDDGWFPGRHSDHAGLGDWRVDPQKFPRGLRPLVERVTELGMRFGIWVEPEMVNPESDLYQEHPDWVYHFPYRPRSEARNQLVLNVGREDVQAYLIEVLSRLVAENGVHFLKWDMNRPISEPGWPAYVQQGGDAREIWVRHVQGVYAIMDALRARHPDLSIESCASGGSRADLGILRRTDQVWASDNTHPEARLIIQEGLSLILPARTVVAWVTDTPSDRVRNEIPLSYRFHVAMLGTLGVGGHLLHWTDEDLAEAARWIAVYKEIRPLVQDGEQYWLLSPTASRGAYAAVEYVTPSADEAIVFAFRRANPFFEPAPLLRLQHLHPEKLYRIQVLGRGESDERVSSGAALMYLGLELPLRASSYESCIVRLRAQA